MQLSGPSLPPADGKPARGLVILLHGLGADGNDLAGVVGYSGRLVDDGTMEGEIASRPPMLLVHGTEDAIVPYESLDLSRQGLEALQVPVETLSCPGLGHGIDPAGLEAGGAFLQRVLPA